MEKPKLLYIDVETAPSLGYYFDLWKEGNIVRTVKNWFILSYAYKWEHEKTYKVRALCDYKTYKKNKTDDRELIADLWKLLDEATHIIAHNGKRFDLRKIRSRFLAHRMNPPSPYDVIDTLQILRSQFAEDSNRLDAFARSHGLGGKLPHQGFKLWEDCINGLRPAWRTMKRYNVQDVKLLVSTYKLVRPWMVRHPDLRIYDKIKGCPVCRSPRVAKRGYTFARTRVYQKYQCRNRYCGKWFQGELIKNES